MFYAYQTKVRNLGNSVAAKKVEADCCSNDLQIEKNFKLWLCAYQT